MTGPAPAQAATPGQAATEFAGWFEAQGYRDGHFEDGDMADAFAGGMQAARDIAAVSAFAPGTGLYLAAIARLCAALRDIKDSHDPGTAAHDMAHTALDDVDQPQRLPDLRVQLDEARAERDNATYEQDRLGGQLEEVRAELGELRAHASSLEEDLDHAGETIADYRDEVSRILSERDRLRDQLAEAVNPTAADYDHAAAILQLRSVLKEHYLQGVTCDPQAKQDNPVCQCSRVHLGWHPSIGQAVDAWIDHVLGVLSAATASTGTAAVPEVRTGPCPVDTHNTDHPQIRTHGHWLCGHVLAQFLAASGIIAAPGASPDADVQDRQP